MYIAILGRQPAISMAELEQLYGSAKVRWFSDNTALVESGEFDINRLGGTQKAGRVTLELHGDWRQASMRIVKHYQQLWSRRQSRLTLGISAYGFDANPREVQKTGLILKSKLKASGLSLRLIPNNEPALNTAASHHNKLGLSDNHVELIVVRSKSGQVIVSESVGAQNITALAARDQARPRTDAFVGMLPPKLARIMVNLTYLEVRISNLEKPTVLDPFCGTGVVLQEALLLGYNAYGTDLSEKMVDYSTENLDWLASRYEIRDTRYEITQGDAMTYQWHPPISAVVCETYLGQPFSAPPSPEKLREVVGNCDHIISGFLKNIHPQLIDGTHLTIAVPAWRSNDGSFTHLPLIKSLAKLGYSRMSLKHVRDEQLLYYRESQVVARELLIIKKT